MEKYFILSWDREQFLITSFEAKDRDEANKIYEEEMTSNFSTDWLLNEIDFFMMKKSINEVKNERE